MTKAVLLCYALKDEQMVGQLKKHLIPLVHNNLITLWDYGSIIPGTDREKEMDTYLQQAHIILLLISADFLASHYCYRVQMQAAIRRHEHKEACVIPIILRPVLWENAPFDKLQALPSPAKPISRWSDKDEGYTSIAMGIVKVIEQWNARSLPDPIVKRGIMIAKLDLLIEAVKTQMQPPGRANATANTLQQLSIFIPTDVTLADLIVGWQTLSRPSQKGDDPPTTSRRITCGELATMASQFSTDQGNLAQAIITWGIWRDAFQNSDDPRQQTMAKTFAREVTELQEAVR